MACTYQSLYREISLINGLFIPAIDQGGLPTQWTVCTGHQPGRSPRPMAGMCRPLIREVSLPDGWYVLAINQGGLPVQWPICTGHQPGMSPCPMASLCWPLIREVSPPNGWYVQAIDQGGLPALRLVYTSHQSGRSHFPMAGMYRPSISTRVRLYSCKGWTLVKAWALCIKEVGPKMQAVDLAWMAVQELLWPLWQFHAIIGQYGGWCGEKMANLAAQGHWMARLAVQNHIWPFWQASTTILGGIKYDQIHTYVITWSWQIHHFQKSW
jgi:hypothetical protein